MFNLIRTTSRSVATARYAVPMAQRCFGMTAYRLSENKTQEETSPEENSNPETLEDAIKQINELTKDLNTINEKFTDQQKKNALLQDERVRALADFENLQKITEKEKKSARDYALTKFAKELVSSIDILDMAIRSVPEEQLNKNLQEETASSLRQLHEGVTMTRKEIAAVLKRHGVTPFDPKGEQFDPNVHEAVFQVPVPGQEPGSILETQEIGYMLNDRLLRPAKVGIVADTQ